jgi:hypothetical protein
VKAGFVLEPPVSRLELSLFLIVLLWWIFGSRMEGVQ